MRGFRTWALCALLLVGLGGCAGSRPDLDAPTETEVAANLRTAFDYIYDNYYDEMRLENVLFPGLESLQTLEPNFHIAVVRNARHDRVIEVRLGDESIYRAGKPSWFAGDGWSAVVRNTIKALRAASPKMADASWVETTDLVLAGVAKALDSQAVYLSRSEMKAVGLIADDVVSEDDGIGKPHEQKAAAGIRLRNEDGTARIAQVRRNSAAAQAGLRPGDIVETLEGQPAEAYSHLQMYVQFVGTPDSEMTLTVRSADGTDRRTVALRRETVNGDVPVAVWRNGILYLQITGLWGDTIDYVKKLLQAERKRGAEGVSGIVLDLRGAAVANPYAAARFLDVFYDGDERYFSTIERIHLRNYTFRPREKPEDTAIRLVVLANGETAAAAEGMVLAFQDLGRAVVVGSTTSGQGHLQTAAFLLNGGIIAFPYARLVTPANFAIEKRGVLPMICSGSLGGGQAAIAQLKSGQGIIGRATRNREIAAGDDAAIWSHRNLCPPRIDQDDRDLELAEAILLDPALYDQVLDMGAN
jgi:carboxyl-terminal processing protease